MLLFENIRLALSSLKANKMRALLTMLGIIIGISSVIAIMTVGNSLSLTIQEEMSTMGANNLTVLLTQKEDITTGGSVTRKVTEDDLISNEMLKKYCERYPEEVISISASQSVGNGGKIQNEKNKANVSVIGVSTGYFLSENIKMQHGHIFTQEEADRNAMVCIISDRAAKQLFKGDAANAPGRVIQVNVDGKYYTFTIVGLYEYQNVLQNAMVSSADLSTDLLIPLKTAQRLTHSNGYVYVTAMLKPGMDAAAFAEETQEFFNRFYKENPYYETMAYSMSAMVESASSIINGVSVGISVIAGIALLVGGIGVMNIMLVSVTERTREIGVRKALGAANRHIRTQFIMESLVICFIGGIIGLSLGIVMGYGGVKLMETMMQEEMQAGISLFSVLLSMGFSLGIGLFFGFYPANKAARLDPIEALRYE